MYTSKTTKLLLKKICMIFPFLQINNLKPKTVFRREIGFVKFVKMFFFYFTISDIICLLKYVSLTLYVHTYTHTS